MTDKPADRITDEMISRATSVVIRYSRDYGTHNDYLSKDTAREVLEAALSATDETSSLFPLEAAPEMEAADRITEQDVREILESYWSSTDDCGDWLKSEDARALLNKLNADREKVPDDTSAQRLWDYYQTLLKHYGFEGITDLLVKYRKLAEQVSAVQSAGDWLPVSAVLPPEGEPFQAFHEDWVDEDFNVYGIRECHRYGDGTQYASAKWFDHQDCWIVNSEVPQLWRPYVKPNHCPSRDGEQGGNND